MKKKIFAIIAAASIVGSTGVVDNSYVVARYAFDDLSGGY